MKGVIVKRAGSGSSVDVAVVGATCAGLVAATELARSGRRVTVVDVRPTGSRPAGVGLASAWTGPIAHRIALHHGEKAAIAYLAGLAAAGEVVRSVAAEHDVPLETAPGWGIAVDGHLAFQLRHEARLLRLAGIRVDFSDDQPFALDVRPMLTLAQQCRVDPAAYIAALEARARDAGVSLTNASVRRIVVPGRLLTDAGTIVADELLDTVGVIGASHAPAVRALRDARRPVVETGPLRWREGEPTSGAVQALAVWMDTPAALVLAGEQGVTVVGRPGGESAALATWARENLAATIVWTGSLVTEESHDGLPVVGRLPGVPHAWVARGFGSADVSGGTWGGQEVARAIVTDASTPATPLRALGDVSASVRARFGVLADPKQRVAEVLRERGLSRRVSESH